jgi:hypothetical protein
MRDVLRRSNTEKASANFNAIYKAPTKKIVKMRSIACGMIGAGGDRGNRGDGTRTMKAVYQDIETIDVPASVASLARRRTHAFLRQSIYFTDALDLLMRSCYLQGLEDGYDAAQRRSVTGASVPGEPAE